MDARKPYRNLQVFADVSNTLQPSQGTAAGLNNKPSTQQQKPKPCISVTSSGFRSAAKQQILHLASQFGAKYSGELVHGCTTHLVCKRLIDCFATLKYQCALEWGIHIVSYDWLVASAAAGHAVPEQDYKDDALDALQPSPAPPTRQHQHQQQCQQQQQEQKSVQAQAQVPQHQHSGLQESCQHAQHQQEHLRHQQQHRTHGQLPQHQPKEPQQHGQDSPARHAEQHAPARRTRDTCTASAHSSSGGGAAGSGQLFTFAAEIPANFLLLGPDSPCSAGAEHGPCSPSQFSCSQYRQDHQQCSQQAQMQQQQQEALVLNGAQQEQRQQQEKEAPLLNSMPQEQQHALRSPAASKAAAGVVSEPGFQFCSGASTPPQQSSPCMQSFLPMQQQQRQLASPGSLSLQQQQAGDNPLAGSELQPDGVLDLPAAPAVAAAAAAAADSSAVTDAEEGRNQHQQQQQQRTLLIPETQFEEFSFLGRPCGTPDSLAHYVSKQRRRQRAAQAAAGLAHQQQQQQQQGKYTAASTAAGGVQVQAAGITGKDGGLEPSADAGGDGQWPPFWLQRAAAATSKQQGVHKQHVPEAFPTATVAEASGELLGALTGVTAAAAAGDCAPQSAGLVRLRRRAAVADASPPDPADLAELEDSDCELEGAAAAATVPAAAAAACAADSGVSSADLTELEDSVCELDGPAAATAAAAMAAEQGLDAADGSGSDCEFADTDSSLNVGSDMPGNTSDLLRDSYDDISDTASSSSSPTGEHEQQRVHGRDSVQHTAAQAAAAADAAGILTAAFAEQRCDMRKHETPAGRSGYAMHGGCSSPHSCSGSSLPSGTCPYSPAGASPAAFAAVAADSGDGANYSATDITAETAGTSAAAAEEASGTSKQSVVQSGLTGEGSQSQMPVMRLTFSLGGCSMGTGCSTDHAREPMSGQSQPQQQQQDEDEDAGQGYAEDWGGEEQGFDSHRDENGEESEAVLSEALHDETQCTADDEDAVFGSVQEGGLDADAASTATSGNSGVNGKSNSRRNTGSGGRLRLRPGSAAAGAAMATAAAGTAATAAALMQKRQVLKQQQQWGDSMLALSERHTVVTPPSEGSMFVTRRKCPKPTAGASTAAAAAAAAAGGVGQESAQQPFYVGEPVGGPGSSLLAAAEAADGTAAANVPDSEAGSEAEEGSPRWARRTAAAAAAAGQDDVPDSDSEFESEVGQGGMVARRIAAAAVAAAAADIPDSEDWDGEEEWNTSTAGRKGAAAAAAEADGARVAPAEQFLKDLKQQHQQKHVKRSACRRSKIAVPKLKQQQNPAEAFLRNLKLQQQQQQQPQPPLDSMLAPDGTSGTIAAVAGARLPRHSVSSSCAGTELSTASHKIPLKLQGGGIVLQPCSTTSSSCVSAAASSTEHGLLKALQKVLAAARPAAGTTLQAHTYAPHEQRQQGQLQVPEVGGDISPGFVGLQQHQQQQQQFTDGDQEAEGGAVAWLHTPEDTQQKQQLQQEQLDLVGMATVGVAARGAAMSKHLGARLAQLSQTQEEVVPLKLLQKAPRGSTAKTHHGLKSSSKLTYADQVQVPWAHATLSAKERSRCVIVAGDSSSSSSSSSSSTAAFIGEPVAFYRLPSGEWWVELLRFYSAKDLRELAKSAGQAVHLPPDFQLSYELLRGMQHEHWAMRQVQGEFKLSKVRKAPTGNRSRAQSPFFWRYSVDTATCQLLTDRPVTDFVVQ